MINAIAKFLFYYVFVPWAVAFATHMRFIDGLVLVLASYYILGCIIEHFEGG